MAPPPKRKTWSRARYGSLKHPHEPYKQSRRGPQPKAQLDRQDLTTAIDALLVARDELAEAYASELPPVSKRSAIRSGLDRVAFASRFLDEVLDRSANLRVR